MATDRTQPAAPAADYRRDSDDMSDPDAQLTVLDEHMARADRQLQIAAGDKSMCAIARSGACYPAAKYHEGARSALVQVRRAVQHCDGTAPADLAAAVHTVTADWTARFAYLAAGSVEWRAYLAGAAQALQDLTEDLTGPP